MTVWMLTVSNAVVFSANGFFQRLIVGQDGAARSLTLCTDWFR
jgi:hypothetical protein